MKRIVVLIVAVALVSAAVQAKVVEKPTEKITRIIDRGSVTSLDVDLGTSRSAPVSGFATAAVETLILAEYDFDASGSACDAQGWSPVDYTAQDGTMFHVDDFAGLGGGVGGNLVAPEGSQAMWCGARPQPASPVFCQYAVLPGYGNLWNQMLVTKECLAVDASVTVRYLASWDSEPGYDATYVEVDECDDDWTLIYGGIGVLDGFGNSVYFNNAVPDNLHTGQLRIRFNFRSDGAFSDEDGLWNTDGAIIIDSLCVIDAGGTVLNLETFEDESPGDLVADDWEAKPYPGYGDFSGLFPGLTVVQEDPCVSNISCVWGFFNGSTETYGCGGFPTQTAVPYVNSREQYMQAAVYSPRIPLAGSGGQVIIEFDVYRDLPLDPLVFYNWFVREWIDGCPRRWQSRASVYFGDQKDWLRARFQVTDLVDHPGTQEMDLALRVRDMCAYWCGVFGTGNCHTHAPLYDNVRVYRVNTDGPEWRVRSVDLFQDNFAGDGTTTGTVRADIAIDIAPEASVDKIVPGDSAVVDVLDPDFGLAGDAHTGSGPAVYAYVTVWPDGSKFGADIASGEQSNNGYERYPLVDSLVHDGKWWYCVRFDTSFTDGANRIGAQADRFAVDLNDDVFTPGDTICYVFAATNTGAQTTHYSEFTGVTADLSEALDNPMEFTCLPAGGWLRGGDILYVDGADGLGAQPYIEEALDAVGFDDLVDRYDKRGPTSTLGNGLGARVVDVEQQLLACYRKIIWSTGGVPAGTIGDGKGDPEKSNDAALLYAFLDGLDDPGGVYLTGDDIAGELSGLNGVSAISLRNKFINYTVANGSHADAGLGVSPTVVGEAGSCFDHIGVPDVLVAYGGCPAINDFDVIAPSGASALEASYNGAGAGSGAIIGQQTLNADSTTVGVLLSGFSFHEIRDADPPGTTELARWHHMFDVLQWLGNEPTIPDPVFPDGARNHLAQNIPNPFNPTTTIRFEVREYSRVKLRVYNIAGQLVRTLVDDERAPGQVHVVEWDGTNTHGEKVSSGVYFYKLTAPDFTKTRKMVLLK